MWPSTCHNSKTTKEILMNLVCVAYTKSFKRYFILAVVCLCDMILTLREIKLSSLIFFKPNYNTKM